jgi:tetratricopeptide (TPR) repeat protein
MEGNAWGRTGRAEAQRLVYADGRVAGWVEGHLQAEGYLWTGNQPVHRHRLACRGVRTGDGAAVAWQFGGGASVTNADRCTWLVSGDPAARQTAVLAVTTPAGVVRQTFRFASFITPRAQALDRPADRLLYRESFLDRVRAVPGPADPGAAWSGDLWSTLVAVLEPYQGGPVLTELFDRGWKTVQRLPPDVRHPLEDRFAETLRLLGDTTRQLAWIDRLETNERDRARQFRWSEERIACHLYDQGDVEAARRAALRMRERAIAPEEIQRAVLRLGDVECVGGNRDQAARLYADAQMRYRKQSQLGALEGLERPAGATPATRVGGTPVRPLLSRATDLKRTDAWKLYAVNDAAQSATIRAFLDQNALEEAFAALAQWENATPMSKLSGDLLLTGARVYFHAGDFRRAAALLKASQQGEVMSSQLPDAMELHLEALMRLKRTDEARELARQALARFPGLPVATRAERLLQDIGR